MFSCKELPKNRRLRYRHCGRGRRRLCETSTCREKATDATVTGSKDHRKTWTSRPDRSWPNDSDATGRTKSWGHCVRPILWSSPSVQDSHLYEAPMTWGPRWRRFTGRDYHGYVNLLAARHSHHPSNGTWVPFWTKSYFTGHKRLVFLCWLFSSKNHII